MTCSVKERLEILELANEPIQLWHVVALKSQVEDDERRIAIALKTVPPADATIHTWQECGEYALFKQRCLLRAIEFIEDDRKRTRWHRLFQFITGG